MTDSTAPGFSFVNYGGSYQLRIDAAHDLAALERLDEVFWMATSAPLDQFTCEPVLLKRLDTGANGRLISDELKAAVRWLLHVLTDRSGVDRRSEILELDALDTQHDDGRRLHDAAERVLENLGQNGAARVTLEQVRDRGAIFARAEQNGDGVIPPEAVDDPALRAFVDDVMKAMGSAEDLSGSPGVNGELLDAFLEAARDLLAWHERSQREADAGLFPLGDDTPARYVLMERLGPALDSYFAQCRVSAVNAMLGSEPAGLPVQHAALYSEPDAERFLASAPVAPPRADAVLPLDGPLNPHYETALHGLRDAVLTPLLGADFDGRVLNPAQWESVRQAFAPYEAWLHAKKGGQIETIGLDTLRGYLDSGLPQRLRTLIEADLAAGEELSAVKDLEYLILLQCWILDICNNFVSFPCLFHPEQRAMCEVGRVVMDGRVLNLNLRVNDLEPHAAAAERSGLHLLYSEVTGPAGSTPFHLVTPVTGGWLGQLGPGKRGVLFDREGREWDVRVISAVENPVSLREAMAAPFKRLGAMVSGMMEKMTGSAEQKLETQLVQSATALGTAPAPDPAAAPGSTKVRDLLLAGGISIAALGSSLAYIANSLAAEGWWIKVLAAVGVGLALVLIPTLVLAVLRLRRQNLSGLLEASGWAINARMRVTRRLRRLIVLKPKRPQGFRWSRRDLTRVFKKWGG
jgi:hypothetical protein